MPLGCLGNITCSFGLHESVSKSTQSFVYLQIIGFLHPKSVIGRCQKSCRHFSSFCTLIKNFASVQNCCKLLNMVVMGSDFIELYVNHCRPLHLPKSASVFSGLAWMLWHPVLRESWPQTYKICRSNLLPTATAELEATLQITMLMFWWLQRPTPSLQMRLQTQ